MKLQPNLQKIQFKIKFQPNPQKNQFEKLGLVGVGMVGWIETVQTAVDKNLFKKSNESVEKRRSRRGKEDFSSFK